MFEIGYKLFRNHKLGNGLPDCMEQQKWGDPQKTAFSSSASGVNPSITNFSTMPFDIGKTDGFFTP